jgi:cupin superfamily acireductone dioxygenase involved in methionine salvage
MVIIIKIITVNTDHLKYTIPQYRSLVWKHEGKRPHGRHRHRWENNINTLLQGREWEYMDLIHVAQDRGKRQDFVNTAMNLQAARTAEIYLTTRGTGSSSRSKVLH